MKPTTDFEGLHNDPIQKWLHKGPRGFEGLSKVQSCKVPWRLVYTYKHTCIFWSFLQYRVVFNNASIEGALRGFKRLCKEGGLQSS